MVAHMNGLHLSDNFQTHNINLEESEPEEAASYNVNLTPQELEQRLKNAQRITVCDQVRKSLREESEIIPQLLLDRIEKPCTAVILWRAPESLGKLMTGFENRAADSDEEGIEMDNNNNNDPNNMDMDLWMIDMNTFESLNYFKCDTWINNTDICVYKELNGLLKFKFLEVSEISLVILPSNHPNYSGARKVQFLVDKSLQEGWNSSKLIH